MNYERNPPGASTQRSAGASCSGSYHAQVTGICRIWANSSCSRGICRPGPAQRSLFRRQVGEGGRTPALLAILSRSKSGRSRRPRISRFLEDPIQDLIPLTGDSCCWGWTSESRDWHMRRRLAASID